MTDTGIREQIDRADRDRSNGAGGPKASLRRWSIPLIVAGIVAAVLIFGIRSRLKSQSTLRTATVQMAVPSVSVARPKPTAPAQEIILPGNIQPFISSPIYART